MIQVVRRFSVVAAAAAATIADKVVENTTKAVTKCCRHTLKTSATKH